MVGRPPKYESAEEMQKDIDAYFEETTNPTVTGIALALGFESRQSFYDYEEKPEFTYTIKTARLRIENAYEHKLYAPACTGAIFALKNLGWKDKIENEQSGTITNINVTVDSSRTSEELKKLIDGGTSD